MEKSQRVVHTIEPVFDARSRILILGSMPSPASRERAFFYGHPQNRFWPVLAAVLEDKTPQDNDAKRAFLLRHRIALWDVLHNCEITGASDASIRNPAPNDLTRILSHADIREIFTTGTTAARLYRRLCYPITQRRAVALPSTSPANCRHYTFESLCEAYRCILTPLGRR